MYDLMKQICLSIKDNSNKTFKDFEVDKETFAKAIDMCMFKDNQLIENALVIRGGIENKVINCTIKDARLTLKGLDFINND